MNRRYRDFNSFLRDAFGCRVQKITVDAGLGCPNRDGSISTGGCSYCNARGSGTGAHARGLSITAQVLAGKQALAQRYRAKKFIVYFQSFSNTYAPLAALKALYDDALAVEDVVGLAIGTRPDCVSEPALDLIAGYASRWMVWVEYGLQSANDATLRAINRGHDSACFKQAVAATRRRGIRTCAHVILGLPGETAADMRRTAETLDEIGIDGLKLHGLYVAKGTALEGLYRSGGLRCLSQHEYIEHVCDFLERTDSAVVVQRLTGDPHPGELVAPAWALQKAATLAGIRNALEKRDTWQGKLALQPASRLLS
jgi:radical SAM protein (TIGR01212 family)